MRLTIFNGNLYSAYKFIASMIQFLKAAFPLSLISSSLFSFAALAEDDHISKGFYLSGSVGSAHTFDTNGSWIEDESGGPHTSNDPLLDWDNSVNGQLSLGYDFGKKYRIELSYIQSYADLNAFVDIEVDGEKYAEDECWGKFSAKAFHLIGYRDFPLKESKITPYIGAGFGISEVYYPDLAYQFDEVGEKKESNLGYQFKLGANYEFTPKADLFSEIAYINHGGKVKTGNIDDDPGLNMDATNSVGVNLGFRYRF